MELFTKDLILRTVCESDIEEVARMWKYPERLSLADAHRLLTFLEQRHSKNRVGALHHLCLGVFRKEAPGTVIGWCGLDGQAAPGTIVLFYSIGEEFRCRGYATQCATELLRYAFEDLQYDAVYGGCAKENPASFRVMEKAGMRHHEVYDDGGLGFIMDREMFLRSRTALE